MKQFAIIGLGSFGKRMLEELLKITSEIIIIDKDKDVINRYKSIAKAAYITDVIDENALMRAIPSTTDAAIVDLGGKIELSIMTTNYLKKIGIREILVKAQTDEHGEILQMIGATKVVFPDREASLRITPMLASSRLFSYMPISSKFAIAEVKANEACVGKALIEANLREKYNLNVVAMRCSDSDDIKFISDPDYIFLEDDILLVAGSEESIRIFSNESETKKSKKGNSFFKSLFGMFR